MASDVFTRTLTDDRRSLTGWAVGATLAGVMYASFYPQLADGQMAEAVANYPEAMREAFRLDDLTSAAGYLGSSVFGLILPLIVLPLLSPAVIFGAGAVELVLDGMAGTGALGLLAAFSAAAVLLSPFAAAAAVRLNLGS